MDAFEVVCEIEPATRPDLTRVRHQIGVLSTIATRFLIPDNHIGRATVSSVAVAHEVAQMGCRGRVHQRPGPQPARLPARPAHRGGLRRRGVPLRVRRPTRDRSTIRRPHGAIHDRHGTRLRRGADDAHPHRCLLWHRRRASMEVRPMPGTCRSPMTSTRWSPGEPASSSTARSTPVSWRCRLPAWPAGSVPTSHSQGSRVLWVSHTGTSGTRRSSIWSRLRGRPGPRREAREPSFCRGGE